MFSDSGRASTTDRESVGPTQAELRQARPGGAAAAANHSGAGEEVDHGGTRRAVRRPAQADGGERLRSYRRHGWRHEDSISVAVSERERAWFS